MRSGQRGTGDPCRPNNHQVFRADSISIAVLLISVDTSCLPPVAAWPLRLLDPVSHTIISESQCELAVAAA